MDKMQLNNYIWLWMFKRYRDIFYYGKRKGGS